METRALRHNDSYTAGKMIAKIVAQGLANIVSGARGSCVSLTSRRVLESAGTAVSVSLISVKRALNGLAASGYIVLYNGNKGKYILCKQSQLWNYLKAGDLETVASIIYRIL